MTTTRPAFRRNIRLGCVLVLVPAVSLSLATTATASGARPGKIVDEEDCFTEPVPAHDVPVDVAESFAVGSPVYGDDALWSVAANRSWFEESMDDPPGPAIAGLKLGWYRRERGRVEVSVTMLPSSVDQLEAGLTWKPLESTARVPDGYGLHGFQVSGIEFVASGCWLIVGELVSPNEQERVVISTMSFLIWVPARPSTSGR